MVCGVQKASREWAAPEDKGQQARGPGGVRRAARATLGAAGDRPLPRASVSRPVEWGGSPGMGGCWEESGAGPIPALRRGRWIQSGRMETDCPSMKPADSDMSLGVPAHVTENLRQDNIPPTSHPCILPSQALPLFS